MDRTENDLFRQAIIEALSQNNREELAECTDPVIASKKHYRKMSAILGFRVRRTVVWTRAKKMWVAAIIAAALLLTGCAVANYKTIGEFIVNFYEDRIEMTDNSGESLNHNGFEMYELTYVPEGYVLMKTVIGATTCNYEWHSALGGDYLRFTQYGRDSAIHTFDESVEWIDTGSNQIEIHYTGKGVRYLWYTEQYVFSLHSSCVLEKSELQKIVEGVALASSN